MSHAQKAANFQALHIKGDPIILYNIWDAGSAQTVANAGAKALATGSWPVAAAFGYEDGEKIPLDLMIENLSRIIAGTDLPVSSDIEGGYGTSPDEVATTVTKVIATGAVGFNFEDQIVGGLGLYDIADQKDRITAARTAADSIVENVYINARTDIFLKAKPDTHSDAMLDDTIDRAKAYADAGASGFFAPGLADADMIEHLCAECPLPVNIIALPHVPDSKTLANLGVARISYGPVPYKKMTAWLEDQARSAFDYK